jgi:hypothetical protein
MSARYSADGRVAAQLMGPDRPVFPTTSAEGRPVVPPDLKARAFDTSIAYYGTYTVDAAAGVVTHHILGAVSPALVGTTQPRRFRFEGDCLILSPPGREETGEGLYLTWRRVGTG